MALLEVRGLVASYGGAPVLDGLDVDVDEGELVLLLGANGAGKSTLLRSVSGIGPRVRGSIRVGGHEVVGRAAHDVVRAGVAMVPEGRRIFPELTVLENLHMGGYLYLRDHGEHRASLERMFQLFPRLGERRGQPAGTLSGGEAQMLAIARALMSRPRVLTLDEPSLGLAPLIVQEVFRYARELSKERGMAVLLAEQAASAALTVADRGYVLGHGRVMVAGTAKELADNKRVRDVYLGAPVEG